MVWDNLLNVGRVAWAKAKVLLGNLIKDGCSPLCWAKDKIIWLLGIAPGCLKLCQCKVFLCYYSSYYSISVIHINYPLSPEKLAIVYSNRSNEELITCYQKKKEKKKKETSLDYFKFKYSNSLVFTKKSDQIHTSNVLDFSLLGVIKSWKIFWRIIVERNDEGTQLCR